MLNFERWLAAVTVCVGLCVAACSGADEEPVADPTPDPVDETSDETTEPVEAPSTEGCAELAKTCSVRQFGCVGAVEGVEAQCKACEPGHAPAGPLAQCDVIAGEPIVGQLGTIALEAGEERDGVCQSWTLNNETELWVNAVEFQTDGYYHHGNWFFVPNTAEYPDGVWEDCYDNGFSEIEAALTGGVLYAQSTQINYELQRFPKGVAVRIPPYSRIVGATHLLNYSGKAVETSNSLTLYTLKPDEVTVKLTPFRLTYGALDIPAKATAEFTSVCDIREQYETYANRPLDLKLYYALPHVHSLGNLFRLSVAGGENDGQLIFEQSGYSLDPFGRVFDPPIDLTGAHGFRFTCGYDNPRDVSVGWGIGDQEMCVMLGFAESPIAFDGSVKEGAVVAPGTGGDSGFAPAPETVQNEGPCDVLGYPFAQTKPGGEPQ